MNATTVRITLGLTVFSTSACGSSPTSSSAPTPSQVFTEVVGYVADTAARPLVDVRVEIVERFQTVASTVSDADGRVNFSGSFASPVIGRATKDGYVTASQSVQSQNSVPPSLSTGYVHFSLEPVAAAVTIETGDYTLAFAADSGCTDLPGDMRRRTYAANITSDPTPELPLNTQYRVSVAGTESWCCRGSGGLGIGVAGNYVAITDDTGPEFTEVTPPFNRLEFTFGGGFSAKTPTLTTMSFSGGVVYCELNQDPAGYFCQTVPKDILKKLVFCSGKIILTRK